MKVAFYRTRTLDGKGQVRLLNRLLSLWSDGQYTHVEAIVDEDLINGETIYRCVSSSPQEGLRIVRMPLDPNRWELVELPCLHAQDVKAWFETRLGEGYNWLGFLNIPIRRFLGLRLTWTAAEAVAASLGLPKPWYYDVQDLHDFLVYQSLGTQFYGVTVKRTS